MINMMQFVRAEWMAKSFLTNFFIMIYVFHTFNKHLINRTLVTKKIVMKKQMHYSALFMILFLMTGLFSCERLTELYRLKESAPSMDVKGHDKDGKDIPGDPCGEPVIVRLVSVDNMSYSPGNAIITNDGEFLNVKFEVTEQGLNIDMIYLEVGPLDLVPLDQDGLYPAFWDFSYQYADISVTSLTHQIPLADLAECFVVLAQVRFIDSENNITRTWTEGINPDWTGGPFYTYYCVEMCDENPTDKDSAETKDEGRGGKDKD